MKRQQADKAPHAGKREKGPKAWNPKGLRDATGFLRLLLDEIDGFAKALQERGVESITLEVGHGAESYDLAARSLNAWVKGVREAVLEKSRPKNGEQ